MAEQQRNSRRFFSVEEANARLPLVRAIVTDLAELARDILDRRQRLSLLLEGRKSSSADAYGDELRSMQQQLEKDSARLDEYVQELLVLGVEPKGAVDGLVDFPAMMEGREVCLCWRLGETEIHFWHEVDAGFAGRQPLVIAAGVEHGESSHGGDPLAGEGEH